MIEKKKTENNEKQAYVNKKPHSLPDGAFLYIFAPKI